METPKELISFRNYKRKIQREKKKISEEFEDLIRSFTTVLFSYDWDASEDLKSFPIFIEYNSIWILFCERWNSSNEHFAKANSRAFYEFAIEKNPQNEETINSN